MRTLILSYLSSVALIVLVSLPSVMATPLEMIPRIGLYLGIPSAILLSMLMLVVTHFVQTFGNEPGPDMIVRASERRMRSFNANKAA